MTDSGAEQHHISDGGVPLSIPYGFLPAAVEEEPLPLVPTQKPPRFRRMFACIKRSLHPNDKVDPPSKLHVEQLQEKQTTSAFPHSQLPAGSILKRSTCWGRPPLTPNAVIEALPEDGADVDYPRWVYRELEYDCEHTCDMSGWEPDSEDHRTQAEMFNGYGSQSFPVVFKTDYMCPACRDGGQDTIDKVKARARNFLESETELVGHIDPHTGLAYYTSSFREVKDERDRDSNTIGPEDYTPTILERGPDDDSICTRGEYEGQSSAGDLTGEL
ncbi:MAG: hypothetical protein M1827_005439 [Pycnora praestabilis]|nr:MAG: hypothetical protein M1827_005439 [Pycnora praestabilis]